MSPWWILDGFATVVLYEVVAVIRHKTTISEFVWRGLGAFPQLGFLSGLGIGLLLGHLYL